MSEVGEMHVVIHCTHRYALPFVRAVAFLSPVLLPLLGKERLLDWTAAIAYRLMLPRTEVVR